MVVGSVSEGTVTKGADLDIFVIFPDDTEVKELEKWGLEIGQSVLDDPEKLYTQHPYITGKWRGIDSDIVPCMDIGEGSRIKTAMDRTPLHTDYVNSRLDEKRREDVILLKSFLKGIGCYGAEELVGGFSGYLVELMVLKFGSFEGAVEYFSGLPFGSGPPRHHEEIRSTWDPEVKFEPVIFDEENLLFEDPRREGSGIKEFSEDTWTVIDPVDPERNVASPVSDQTLSLLSHSSRELTGKPGPEFFWPESRRPIDPSKKEEALSELRGSNLLLTRLPNARPGIVIAQLRSALGKCCEGMKRRGFSGVFPGFALIKSRENDIDGSYLGNRAVWSSQTQGHHILITLRTDPSRLPEYYTHWGPPDNISRAEDFINKWKGKTRVSSSGGRLYVRLKNEKRDPVEIFSGLWDHNIKGTYLDGLRLETIGENRLSLLFVTPSVSG